MNTNKVVKDIEPITLAISGASGSIYGFRTLEFLLDNSFRVNLIFSEIAQSIAQMELNIKLDTNSINSNTKTLHKYLSEKKVEYKKENLQLWDEGNLAACISSGSYRTSGMIISPCSMGTLARIANGTSEDLISRSADVCLKERQKLVLVIRETPLSSIHLQNMLTLSNAGAVILPAVPGFYHNPKTMQDLVDFVVGKSIDSFGLDHDLFKRWMS